MLPRRVAYTVSVGKWCRSRGTSSMRPLIQRPESIGRVARCALGLPEFALDVSVCERQADGRLR